VQQRLTALTFYVRMDPVFLRVIFLNKICADGFSFPLMATALGQFFSCLGGAASHSARHHPRRPSKCHLCPVDRPSCDCAALYTGNFAAITLSVSFILKGLTPGVHSAARHGAGPRAPERPLATAVSRPLLVRNQL
jgi:hypothetical protein